MDWKHGYYADAGYTYGFYPEASPARLQWAALIQGHALPRQRFRYLDAGCGQGLSVIFAAAAHPDSEFVGIDFLPEHIAHARRLAEAAGLDNVTFVEGDFVTLARNPAALGAFDYAICHGITTWIAPEVKSALFDLIGQTLRPGGVFYNSYNTYPGWLASVPFQHYVLLEQRTKTGTLALKAARELMERLQKIPSPSIFASLPGLQGRLKSLESQDPAYLVQEYNNQFWQPVFVTEMIDAMAAVKLSYLGTATLPEAFDNLNTPELKEILDTRSEPALREQIRDYALNQSFRRDLYAKGVRRPWPLESRERIMASRFVRNWATARPEPGAAFVIKGGSLELKGDAAFYGSILDRVEQASDGCSVGELMAQEANPQRRDSTPQVVSLLLHAGYVLERIDADQDNPASITRLNRVLCQQARMGAPYRFVAVPRTGGCLAMSEAEMLLMHYHFEGVAHDDWIPRLLGDLEALGRVLVKDGQAVTQKQEQAAIAEELTRKFIEVKLGTVNP
jgi:SAM-dependent methyltransferase